MTENCVTNLQNLIFLKRKVDVTKNGPIFINKCTNLYYMCVR